MSINCLQRTGIADGRAIEKLLPEQKIVNEQKVEIMILSTKENVKPEQMLNSEPQTIVSTSAPAIGNTNVSSRFEILRASYWEHFKAAKDLSLYLPPSHPKRVELEKEINKMLVVLNGC